MMVSFAEDIYGYIMKSGDDGNKLESRDKDGDGGFGREDGVGDGVVGIDIGVTTEPFFHDKARVIGESGEYVFDEEGDEEDGEESASQIYLLGYDSLLRLFSPEYYAQGNINSALAPFFESCAVRVTIREDDNNKKWGRKEEQVRFVEGLRDEWGLEGRIECVQGVERLEGGGDGGVSSTRVREMARDGDEVGVRGFCTRGVGEWVLGEGVYRD